MTNEGLIDKINDIEDKTIKYRVFYLYVRQAIVNGGVDYLEPIFQSKVFFEYNCQILGDLLYDDYFMNSKYGVILRSMITKFVLMHRRSKGNSEEFCNQINELVIKCNRFKEPANKEELEKNHSLFVFQEMISRGARLGFPLTYDYIYRNYGLISTWDYLYYINSYVDLKKGNLKNNPIKNAFLNIMSTNKIRNDYLPMDIQIDRARVLTNKVE